MEMLEYIRANPGQTRTEIARGMGLGMSGGLGDMFGGLFGGGGGGVFPIDQIKF
jgi:hypothetical protein